MTALGAMLSLPAVIGGSVSSNQAGTSWAAPAPKMLHPTLVRPLPKM
jgi:hypothetical protein